MNKRKSFVSKKLKGIAIILLSSFVFLLLLYLILNHSREKGLISDGNIIIEKIEKYKNQNKKLPESMKEIGLDVKEDGPIYYNKFDSNEYIISFGYGVGESINYNSKTGKWDDF